MDNQPPADNDSELETLESPTSEVEPTETGSAPAAPPDSPPPSKPTRKRLRDRLPFLNVYMLFFVLLLLAAAGVGIFAYLQGKKSPTSSPIASQTLDAKALSQLANTDTTVGSSSQVLNVQSDAVFAGKVLVRSSLEVAGGLQIGGNLSLSGVTVSGSSSFGQVQVNKNLAVQGDSALQGSLTVQKSVSVNGNGTFAGSLAAGSITTSALQLNGDLNLTHHLTAGGPTPSRSSGTALGSGGTVSISGSDTSGSITVNTGGSPAAGCFITVNFVTAFNATPHVLVTPVGSAAAGLAYYVNRSTTSFSVCSASNPPAGSTFGYDYFVLD